MKNLDALAMAATLAATTATAGGMAEPVMEMAPAVVVEDAAGGTSNASVIVPLILIALIAAAASGGSDSPADPCVATARAVETDLIAC